MKIKRTLAVKSSNIPHLLDDGTPVLLMNFGRDPRIVEVMDPINYSTHLRLEGASVEFDADGGATLIQVSGYYPSSEGFRHVEIILV